MTTTQAAGITKPAAANATALMSMPDSKECADATNDAAERADRAKAEHGSAGRDDRSPMPITAAQMQGPMLGARSVRHGYSPLRLHLVEEAVNLVCVISLVDGSPSKRRFREPHQESGDYASSNAPRQRPGRHRPHPSDSRGSRREDLKTGYGKRLQRSSEDDSARHRRGSAVTR